MSENVEESSLKILFNFNRFKKRSLALVYTFCKANKAQLKRIKNKRFYRGVLLAMVFNSSLETIIRSHEVVCLEVMNEHILFAGDSEGNILLYDLVDNNILNVFTGHVLSVNCIKLTSIRDESLLLSGGSDKSIRIWKFDSTSCCLKRVDSLLEHQSWVTCIEPFKDGFFSGSLDKSVVLWGLDNLSEDPPKFIKKSKFAFPSEVNCVKTFTHMNNFLILGGTSNSAYARIFQESTSVLSDSKDFYDNIDYLFNGQVSSLLVFDSNTILIAIQNNIFQLLLDQNFEYKFIKGHSNWISSLIKLSNELFASSSWDRSIRIWSNVHGKCLKVLDNCHSKWISCIVKLNDGEIVSCGKDKVIKFWNF